MIRRSGYLVVTLGFWALNTIERYWHGPRTRTYNAGHHGAVTTRKPKP